MKRINYFSLAFIALALTFNSCKDESKDVFSSNTVEENKSYIEDQGIEMVDIMKSMDDEAGVEATASLANFLSSSDITEVNTKAGSFNITEQNLFKPVFATAKLNSKNSKTILKALKSATEEPETLTEYYESLVGIYTWNAETEGWDYSESATNIQFYFPSTENGTTNNASYIIDYTGTTETYTISVDEDSYTGDLPQNLTAELKVDNTVVFTYQFAGAYDSEGVPTSINTSITMGEFVFKIEGSNTNNASLELSYSFIKSDETIMKFELGVKGNWTPENLDQDELFIQDVVNSGNASFRVLGIKAVGEVDVKNLADKLDKLNEEYDADTFEEDSIWSVEYINTINQYTKLSLRYVSNNNIIAKMEAYPMVVEETYTNYVYNWNTGELEPYVVTEKYIELGLRFVFGDGSKVDAEVYFEDGFDGLINEMQDYFDELEGRYDI